MAEMISAGGSAENFRSAVDARFPFPTMVTAQAIGQRVGRVQPLQPSVAAWRDFSAVLRA